MTVNGTLTRGTAAFTTGKFGQALSGGVYSVTGADAGFASVNSSLGTGTFEAWMKTTATSTRVVLGRGNFYWFGVTAAGLPTAKLGVTNPVTLTGTVAINDGAWHHMALVVVAGAGSLYVDGARVATSAATNEVSGTESGGLMIGGFGTTATFDFAGDGGGLVDEVRFSSVARYTGTTYTTPTTAFTSDASTTALYHLDGDATDATGAGGTTAPGQPTGLAATAGNGQASLSWTAPASDGGAAITDYTVQYRTTAGPGAWTTFADAVSTATSAVVTGLTNGTGYDFQVAAVNSVGTGTYSATASATPSASAPNIAPNDPNIVYSPYNWDRTSARALTVCGGAYFRALIAGSPTAITLNFDVSSMTGTFPSKIAYRIDGGGWTEATVAATVAVPLPSATSAWTEHLIEVAVKSTTQSVNRWASPYATAVKFTGITTTPGTCTTAAIQSAGLRGIVLGDSITEGNGIFSNSGDATVQSDATLGFAFRLRDFLGAEVGVVGFGGLGLTVGGNGNVPALTSSWKLNAASLNRSFTSAPDFAVVNIGTNDSRQSVTSATFQAALTTFLNDAIATLPSSTKIVVLLPFGGYYGTTVFQAAIAAATDPTRIAFVDTTGWFNTANSSDGIHPYGYADLSNLGPRTAAAVKAALLGSGGSGSGRYVNVGGVAKLVGTVVKG